MEIGTQDPLLSTKMAVNGRNIAITITTTTIRSTLLQPVACLLLPKNNRFHINIDRSWPEFSALLHQDKTLRSALVLFLEPHDTNGPPPPPKQPNKSIGKQKVKEIRAQELCEQGGGPGLSFPVAFFPRP